ncbi:MAG: ATP synthase F0 subunit C [Clostridiales Family XIII bacterium]|jgi:F-type H+-transporting ATPase subunit c|nr:ATP synthase F0 subunit C [Clostridiales Family XIII bacterium]
MSNVTPEAFVLGLSAIASAIVMFVGFGVGLGQGLATGKAVESIARQPEAKGDIMSTMFAGLAMTETSVIFALIVALVLLFANPLVGKL